MALEVLTLEVEEGALLAPLETVLEPIERPDDPELDTVVLSPRTSPGKEPGAVLRSDDAALDKLAPALAGRASEPELAAVVVTTLVSSEGFEWTPDVLLAWNHVAVIDPVPELTVLDMVAALLVSALPAVEELSETPDLLLVVDFAEPATLEAAPWWLAVALALVATFVVSVLPAVDEFSWAPDLLLTSDVVVPEGPSELKLELL